ncbi:MAG: hypothetical protein J4428_04555 [Candidatus Aenigmarchaeota archaeon]|nr:hypothetical protein [Candidatus Aenigmarchaeota archaeon]
MIDHAKYDEPVIDMQVHGNLENLGYSSKPNVNGHGSLYLRSDISPNYPSTNLDVMRCRAGDSRLLPMVYTNMSRPDYDIDLIEKLMRQGAIGLGEIEFVHVPYSDRNVLVRMLNMIEYIQRKQGRRFVINFHCGYISPEDTIALFPDYPYVNQTEAVHDPRDLEGLFRGFQIGFILSHGGNGYLDAASYYSKKYRGGNKDGNVMIGLSGAPDLRRRILFRLKEDSLLRMRVVMESDGDDVIGWIFANSKGMLDVKDQRRLLYENAAGMLGLSTEIDKNL